MSGMLAGKDAIRIMVEEIGEAIGPQRLREFDVKTRAKMRELGMAPGAPAKDWITAMAEVIVADDDKRANDGFMKGIRRIRKQSERVGVAH